MEYYRPHLSLTGVPVAGTNDVVYTVRVCALLEAGEGINMGNIIEPANTASPMLYKMETISEPGTPERHFYHEFNFTMTPPTTCQEHELEVEIDDKKKPKKITNKLRTKDVR